MEFDKPPFVLRGWTYQGEVERGIDKLDPHAGDISYPPYRAGSHFANQFDLIERSDGRVWTKFGEQEPVLKSRLWGRYIVNDHDGPVRHGNRLSASVDFLKEVCASLGANLILEVQISRNPDRTYSGRSDDSRKRDEETRIFLFSADGKLRDTETLYQVG
jgi:hypothetical protein